MSAAVQPLAIVNGTLIDGTGAETRPGCTVLVQDGVISALGEDLAIPEGARVIDADGGSVLPGLIDMHGHLYARATTEMRSQFVAYPLLYLAGGVTTVRSPADFDPAGTVALREQIRAGEVVGPRIFTAGPYFDHAPSIVKWIAGIGSVDEALAVFERWKDTIDEVKVYTRITEAEFAALAEAAHAHDLPIAAHLGSITLERALELGLDRQEHALFAMPDFDRNADSNGMVSPAAIDEIDLDGDIAQRLIEQLVERQTVVCPTVTVFQIMRHDNPPFVADWERYFSPEAREVQRQRRAAQPVPDPAEAEALERALDKQLEFIKRLHDAGGRLVCGTDPVAPWLTPGYGLHREIENFAAAGLTPLEAIRSATLVAAGALGCAGELGSVEPGKRADVVIVDGDPTRAIADIGRTRQVICNGVVHDPAALRESVVGLIG